MCNFKMFLLVPYCKRYLSFLQTQTPVVEIMVGAQIYALLLLEANHTLVLALIIIYRFQNLTWKVPPFHPLVFLIVLLVNIDAKAGTQDAFLSIIDVMATKIVEMDLMKLAVVS